MSIKDGILDLPIKKYWFNKIKAGEKTHEYRNAANWDNKLGNGKYARYTTIRFRQGQVVKSTDKCKVLYAKIKSVKVVDGINTDLKVKNQVFDIEFELLNTGKIDD
nr:MAG TPA: ASCH domain protein [Caudoviricetes sp.]